MATIAVVPGEQVWRLIRTDRDAASVAEVEATVGPAMAFFLAEAQPGASGSKVEAAIQTGPREWRIGAARPIQVVAIERFREGDIGPPPGAALPEPETGGVLANRFDADGLPTVQGTLPWAVVVRFWWRGVAADLPFPALRVSPLGVRSREVVDADWYLDEALEPAVKQPDPGDESFGDAIGDDVAEAAGELGEAIGESLKVIGGILAAVAFVYVVSKVYKR